MPKIERSSPEQNLAIDTASAIIRKMFDRQNAYAIDDSEFLPLVGCVTEGLREAVIERGVSKSDAKEIAKDAEAVAYDVYLKICQKNDPECTAAEVLREFRTFMKGQ